MPDPFFVVGLLIAAYGGYLCGTRRVPEGSLILVVSALLIIGGALAK